MNQRELFLRHVAQTSPSPLGLEIVRAKGVELQDAQGRTFLDLIGGISVCNLGHCHSKVTEAIKDQVDRYLHLMVYGEFIQSPQVQYAQALATLLPKSLNCVYFTNSGAEATEGAMKLAKRVTGRTQILAFNQSYHGSTQGALSILGDESFRRSYRPLLPGIGHLEFNSWADLDQISEDTACVIAETVQAESGVHLPDAHWIRALEQTCRKKGSLLILDEVQVGMGRTGKLWAFEQFGVQPDILLLGKALGGGMPLGAFISDLERMRALTHGPALGHITTFGGHPVSCAAGHASLKALLEEGWINEITFKESLFAQQLVHPLIRNLRSCGLLLALELDSADRCKKVVDICISQGLLTDWFLFAPHCLRLAPPLIISREQITHACQIILTALDQAR